MTKITIKENNIDDVVKISATIDEFDRKLDKEYFENRYEDKEHLIIVAYVNSQPAGYIVAYNRFNDSSLYCWMGAVNSKFRKMGILTQLMDYQDKWAKKRGYNKIKIKTRNNKRAMLHYLVKHGFMFTGIEPRSTMEEYRIFLEKDI